MIKLLGLPETVTTAHKFLLVDCESAAKVADAKFKTYTVLWPSEAWCQTRIPLEDWFPLNGCEVVCWASNVPKAHKIMVEMANTLAKVAGSVRMIYVNGDARANFSAADMGDWEPAEVQQWVRERVKAYTPDAPPPPPPGSSFYREPGDDPQPRDTPRERNRKKNHDVPPKPAIGDVQIADIGEILNTKVAGREWLIEQILPVGAFLIVGRPKIGKSWLLMQLAIAVTTCRDFLGFMTLGKAGALYIGAEDDIARMQGRWQRFQVETPKDMYVVVRESLLALVEKYAAHYTLDQWLDGYLEANPHVKMVLLDTETTIRNMWEGENGGSQERSITKKDYMDVTAFDRIALKRSVFIGLVNHTAKRKGSGQWADIHELINRTNTALAGASGSIVLADPPDHDPMDTKSRFCVLGIRGRDIMHEHLIALEHTDYGSFNSLGTWAHFSQSEAQKEIWDAAIEIAETQAITNAWIQIKEIAEVVGKKYQTVKRGISRMAKDPKNLIYNGYRMDVKRGEGIRLVKIL